MADLTRKTDGKVVQALDAMFQRRMGALEIPVLDVLDPDRCPTKLLPWLAWHYGLLHFDSRWPETVQRNVIASARVVLRERGLRRGVERALQSYGASVEVVERKDDPSLEPGTFVVRVAADDAIVTDGTLQDEIDRAVSRSAPLTRTWTIELGFGASWGLRVASATHSATYSSLRGTLSG